MKEYRIVRTKPDIAIINVVTGTDIWAGYTNFESARKDMMKLKAAYPGMDFLIVEYIELEV